MADREDKGMAAPADDPFETKPPLPQICCSFLGLGVYRAWIEVCFVGSFISYPEAYSVRSVYDLSCVAVLFLCALTARRLAPLFRHRVLGIGAACLMSLAGAAGFVSIACPAWAGMLGRVASLFGGAGTAVIILLWSELYGCVNPVRIALYYALSQLTGAAIVWTLKGLGLPWLAFWTCALPFISLAMVQASFAKAPQERLPHVSSARFTFPWKPVVLVCVYAFAFGVQEADTYAFTGPHSGLGMMLNALLVVVGILALNRKVEFGTIYSLWLPVLMMASLVLSLVGTLNPFLKSTFVSLSYGAAELFIMTMIGSICYRYRVNAVWIFGIERGVRMLAMMAGRLLSPYIHDWTVGVIVVAAAVGTWLIFSERGLASNWGVVLYEEGEDLCRTAVDNARGERCAQLGREHGLTAREQEVLLLLAQHKSAGDIERELCVAHGTAKAHIRHVYRKLDIHAREELFALTDVTGRDGR